MADLVLSVDYSQLVAAAKTTDQTKQAIRLLGQQFARTGNQSAYMRTVNQIVNSQKNLSTSARLSRSEIMRLANQYRQTTLFADELARAQMQLNAVTQASTRGFARSGVVMQQTGYQVGDFLVQVQSGTNAFVAFGQQATQLAGLLTMSVNPKIIALGAGLSIAIPLLTAIAAAFMRTSGAGKTFADRLEEANQAIDDLKDAADLLSLDSLSRLEEMYGRVNDEVREFLTLSTEAIRLQAIEDVIGSLNSLRYELRGFLSTETTSLQSLFNINLGQANQLVSALTRAAEATDLDTQLQHVVQLRDRILQLTGGVENMTSEQRQFYLQVIEAEGGLRRALTVAQQVSGAIGQGATNASVLAGNLLDVLSARNAINAGFAAPGTNRGVGTGRSAGPGGPLIGTIETVMAALSAGRAFTGVPREPETRNAQQQEDYLAALQKEADLKLQMIGLSEEDQRRLRIIYELTERGLPIEEERIQKILETEAALQKATEAEQRRQSMMDSVQGHIEKGLMSLIEGSKSVEEAFRNTIRSILADIYQSAVIKPIASGISSFLFGGRESGGSMMPNRPYVVGERGPELVIPGRSATVMNADLTRKSVGGESIVVNNNINVTGGTDPAAIRMEVAKLMPTITNATKTAVIDARRRGGQMKAAFQ